MNSPALRALALLLSLGSVAHAQAPGQPAYPPSYRPPSPQPTPTPGAPGTPGAAPTYGASGPVAQPTRAEQELREAEQLDSGRGLEWFYVGAQGGVFWLGDGTLSQSGAPLLGGGKQVGGVGPSGGLFAGARFYVLTVGARVRTAWLPDSQFLSAGGEARLHVPMGAFEPYVGVGAGYATLLGDSVRGFEAGLRLGLDYYLSNHFTVGALATLDLVALSRSATPTLPKGSAVSLAASGSAVLGLHF